MMRFEKQIPISAPPEEVWALLWNVERLASCIPGCSSAQVITPRELYEAHIKERIGPFVVQLPLQIRVLGMDEPRWLKAEAVGCDLAAGWLNVALLLTIERIDGSSLLSITAHVSLGGKFKILGAAVVERKAQDVLNRFGEAIRKELEAASEATATAK